LKAVDTAALLLPLVLWCGQAAALARIGAAPTVGPPP
jgi:hypothetical protein